MKINEKIVESIMKTAMARGTIVVDESVEFLTNELKDRNIKVVNVRKGTSDEEIKKIYLPGRIFITNNYKDFIDDASSFEYGIISTEKIKMKDAKKLAKRISREIIKNKLWAQKLGFILILKEKASEFKFLKD